MIQNAMVKNNFAAATATVLLTVAIIPGFAGQLDETKVPTDAKWVVHVDFEAFRKSAVGTHFLTKFLEPKINENDFFKKANLSINLSNISGLTAYGPNFEKDGDGVLLLATTADVKKDMDTLVGMASLSENETKDVTMVQQSPFPLYNVKNDLFVAPLGGNTVLLAKSREQVERAREITTGKGETFAKKNPFKDYPAAPKGYFFAAMAQGFNENANIPPQAQVLRETEGGRFLMGESDKNLFLNLVFKGKDQEATTKIQQVLQGIVALVSMSQQNNPDLIELANSTKISGEGQNVSITLNFPTAKAVQQVDKHVKVKAKKNAVNLDVNAGEKEEAEGADAKE